MADGRKTHKNLVNKANTKLKNELSSIKVCSRAGYAAALHAVAALLHVICKTV
jgi:uncharacterized protein (UPF0332 family)